MDINDDPRWNGFSTALQALETLETSAKRKRKELYTMRRAIRKMPVDPVTEMMLAIVNDRIGEIRLPRRETRPLNPDAPPDEPLIARVEAWPQVVNEDGDVMDIEIADGPSPGEYAPLAGTYEAAEKVWDDINDDCLMRAVADHALTFKQVVALHAWGIEETLDQAGYVIRDYTGRKYERHAEKCYHVFRGLLTTYGLKRGTIKNKVAFVAFVDRAQQAYQAWKALRKPQKH